MIFIDDDERSTWAMIRSFMERSDERRHRRATHRAAVIDDLVMRSVRLELLSLLDEADDDD